MLKALVVLAVFGAALAGCATKLTDGPAAVEQYAVDYAVLADCAYRRLDERSPGAIKLTDLRGSSSIRITAEMTVDGVFGQAFFRSMDILLTRAGERTTIAEIRTATAGNDRAVALSALNACAGQ